MQQESCPTRLLEHRVIGKQKRAAKDKREHLSAAKEVEQGAWRVPGPGRGLRTEARISPASWLVARMEQKRGPQVERGTWKRAILLSRSL